MDVKEEGLISGDIGDHWYYKSKAKALAKYIEMIQFRNIMDVGAGSGYFSKYLLGSTMAEKSTCVDIAYECDKSSLVKGKKINFTRELKSMDADLVLLMDVLEHIDDDVGFLENVIDNVPSGAWFVVSVPAFQILWSRHDEFLGHKRRYTLSTLKHLLINEGLEVKKINYYYGLIFPLVFIVRMLGKIRGKSANNHSDLKEHSPLINRVLSTICGLESSVMNINRLMGLTVFCLCRKP